MRVERSGVTRARRRAAALTEKRIDTTAVDPRRVTRAGAEPTTRSVGGGTAGALVAGVATGVTTGGVAGAGAGSAGGAGGMTGGGGGGGSAGGAPTVIVWVADVLPAETAATVAVPLWVSRKKKLVALWPDAIDVVSVVVHGPLLVVENWAVDEDDDSSTGTSSPAVYDVPLFARSSTVIGVDGAPGETV